MFKAETGLVLVDVVVTDHGARRTSSLDLNPVISPCWKTADPRIAAFNVHSQPSTSPKPVIPAHEELEVKPATYTLRLGVVDRNSRKIGTLDVPLTVLQLAGGPGF